MDICGTSFFLQFGSEVRILQMSTSSLANYNNNGTVFLVLMKIIIAGLESSGLLAKLVESECGGLVVVGGEKKGKNFKNKKGEGACGVDIRPVFH
ncbi:hypothetical protein RJT34_01084 [Clitoria ternatea]|uniref:Uncharacterized protein n=1 Tax=Clitoria ternatea TaxID=43366 RepID=A0AAN9Q0D3_CLITE